MNAYEYRFRRIRRSFASEPVATCSKPSGVPRLMHALNRHADRERFYAIYLNVQNTVIGYECVAVGQSSGVQVSPAEVFRGALLAGAQAIIVCHNHPSGVLSPSRDDEELTQRLSAAGELLGIPLLDHIIVGDNAGYFSFSEADLLSRATGRWVATELGDE